MRTREAGNQNTQHTSCRKTRWLVIPLWVSEKSIVDKIQSWLTVKEINVHYFRWLPDTNRKRFEINMYTISPCGRIGDLWPALSTQYVEKLYYSAMKCTCNTAPRSATFNRSKYYEVLVVLSAQANKVGLSITNLHEGIFRHSTYDSLATAAA